MRRFALITCSVLLVPLAMAQAEESCREYYLDKTVLNGLAVAPSTSTLDERWANLPAPNPIERIVYVLAARPLRQASGQTNC
jgi:hypothetical protein